MKSILEAENLKKIYHGKSVLDVDRLSIKEGRITAIIGPSGAGKTTLLSILNGIEKPEEGRVLFNEEEHSASRNYSPDSVQKMAMVFQKPVMFNTTVYHNITYGLKIRKMKQDEIQRRLREAASWTGLSELLKQKAVTLSGGEAGRVSVARAMVLKPTLLLMDEPTANLDPANVSIIEDMIKSANKEFGTTVILVTHNMFQAKRLADDVVFMMNGKLIEQGSNEEIFEQSQDQRTRSFVSGKMVY